MSVIIDASLSRTPLIPRPEKKDSYMEYVRYLEESGVKYFEISTNALVTLKNEDLSKKYIFRIDSLESAKLCNKMHFAYVTIPWEYRQLCASVSKKSKVILEINADQYNAPAMIMCAMSSKAAKSISMLRINYCIYSTTEKETVDLMEWYKKNYIVPIDVCPINYYMSGCVVAVAAEERGADALTFTYGRNVQTTSLELFMIERASAKLLSSPFEAISSISRAMQYYYEIFMKMPYGFVNIDELTGRVECPFAEASTGNIYRLYRSKTNRKQFRKNIIEKKLESLGYEKEVQELIMQLLRKGKTD